MVDRKLVFYSKWGFMINCNVSSSSIFVVIFWWFFIFVFDFSCSCGFCNVRFFFVEVGFFGGGLVSFVFIVCVV